MITLSNRLADELGLTAEVIELIRGDDWVKVPVRDGRPGEDRWGVRGTQTCASCGGRINDIVDDPAQDETGQCYECREIGGYGL